MSSSISESTGRQTQPSVAPVPSDGGFTGIGGFGGGGGGFGAGSSTGPGDQGFGVGGITHSPTSPGKSTTGGNTPNTPSSLTSAPPAPNPGSGVSSIGAQMTVLQLVWGVPWLPDSVVGFKTPTPLCKNTQFNSAISISSVPSSSTSSIPLLFTDIPSRVRAHRSTTPLGAIIGGAVSGAVIVAAIAIAILIFKYRHFHQPGSYPLHRSMKPRWYQSKRYTINSFDPTSPASDLSMGSSQTQTFLNLPSIFSGGRYTWSLPGSPTLTPIDHPRLPISSKFTVLAPPPRGKSRLLRNGAARSTVTVAPLPNPQSIGQTNERLTNDLNSSADPPPRYSTHEYP
ncbi:hypothetical protein BJ165DRAFT_1527765 [Panaeolus papilionaceus]|nr:hypothetical protein BJ165DRAFT_1527765 [Panaeolus papilionaceus]